MGSSVAVAIFGFLLGVGEPKLIFILVGVFMMIGVASVLLAKVMSDNKPIAE